MISMKAWASRAAAIALALAITSSEAAPLCRLATIDEWPVRLVQNRLIVDGLIDGQKVAIMLGTGAQASIILHSARERLKLPTQWARGPALYGVRGESRLEIANVRDLQIGRVSRKGWSFAAPLDQDLGEGIDAVLGDDFFYGIDVEFDLAHGTVRLFQPGRDCDGVSLAYWAIEGADEAATEAVDWARPQIRLAVRVNDRPVWALLDSGATVSILAKRDAAAAGVTPQTAGVVAAGRLAGFGEHAVDSWTGPFETVVIGSEVLRNTRLRFADLYRNATYVPIGSNLPKDVERDQPMLLGVDFLRAHRVLVAHSQRKIYFTRAGGPVFDTDTKGPVPVASAWLWP
jgi:hypothetical protein